MAQYSRETLIKSIRTVVANLNDIGIDVQKEVDLNNLEYVSRENLLTIRRIFRRRYLKCIDMQCKNIEYNTLEKLIDMATSYGFSYEDIARESIEELYKKSYKKLVKHVENFCQTLKEKIISYLANAGVPFMVKSEFDKEGNVINKQIIICNTQLEKIT